MYFHLNVRLLKRINMRGALLKRVFQSTPLTSAQRLESIILCEPSTLTGEEAMTSLRNLFTIN